VHRAIDHHWEDDKFATAGAAVDIWDHSRAEPISTYSWGADSVLSVRFNPVSPDRAPILSRHTSGAFRSDVSEPSPLAKCPRAQHVD